MIYVILSVWTVSLWGDVKCLHVFTLQSCEALCLDRALHQSLCLPRGFSFAAHSGFLAAVGDEKDKSAGPYTQKCRFWYPKSLRDRDFLLCGCCWVCSEFLSDIRASSSAVLNSGPTILSVWDSNPKSQGHGASLSLLGSQTLLCILLPSFRPLLRQALRWTLLCSPLFSPYLWRINVNQFAASNFGGVCNPFHNFAYHFQDQVIIIRFLFFVLCLCDP